MAMPDITAFREAFPEFSDYDKYTDAMINFWYDFGVLRLNKSRWGSLLNHGLWLFTAHSIVIAAKNASIAEAGGEPGQSAGVISSKGVGDVSVGYDVGSFMENDGGNYNLTSYGREFLRLARIVGIGGAQLLTANVYSGGYYNRND